MTIELIRTNDPVTMQRLVDLEKAAFGSGGLNVWQLVPLIRHGRVFVIRKDDEILGAIQYMLDWENRCKAYVVGISIHQDWRGRSLGTELFAASLAVLSRENISEVELTVAPDNSAAIRVYQDKLGFRRSALLPDEYGEGQDRLVMTKKLKLCGEEDGQVTYEYPHRNAE